MVYENPRYFSAIKKAFPIAHIDKCFGTNQENRDYVFKEGKWLEDEKADTNIRESHYEHGEMPIEEQGKRNDLAMLQKMISNGYSTYQIVSEYPQFAFRINEIKNLRNIHKENEYRDEFRKLKVLYIWGPTGKGKTRYVMEKYGYGNVARITDYAHPFDTYDYEDVMLFEEFRDDIPIKDMLKYLDGYPLTLPCRFANKQAAYTKVYIISNIPIEQQYIETQRNERNTYEALIRRINTYIEFDEYGNEFVFESYEDLRNRRFITLDEYERKGVEK